MTVKGKYYTDPLEFDKTRNGEISHLIILTDSYDYRFAHNISECHFYDESGNVTVAMQSMSHYAEEIFDKLNNLLDQLN